MRTRLIIITICLVVGLAFTLQWKITEQKQGVEETFSKTTLKYGAVGQDVRELQGRLKFLGMYGGAVDGDFGYRTLTAVKRFQGEFGMTVDGVVGAKTKLKLYNATKHWRPGMEGGGTTETAKSTPAKPANIPASSHRGYSSNELRMMANAVYGESRGEPYLGQVAVAAVILNRVEHASFPNTPSGVIFQPGAFTAVADGQIWLEPNATAKKAVQDAINGWDPTDGCIYYFNPATATSKWIWSRPQYKRIGEHIFCR
ncbi:spore cortex-lytic enzyme [Paenibacillus thermotolerans]|uniref:spore cortex-lytic enzyme n=1 Tax=Paenibacillus thermotolerans TaxID=3027807 RepID=UPI002367EEC4|nr:MULTISPECIES: spore cortex-lytic enzyme [unclassified Paenibacillus]